VPCASIRRAGRCSAGHPAPGGWQAHGPRSSRWSAAPPPPCPPSCHPAPRCTSKSRRSHVGQPLVFRSAYLGQFCTDLPGTEALERRRDVGGIKRAFVDALERAQRRRRRSPLELRPVQQHVGPVAGCGGRRSPDNRGVLHEGRQLLCPDISVPYE
jgi:hypothetical protein